MPETPARPWSPEPWLVDVLTHPVPFLRDGYDKPLKPSAADCHRAAQCVNALAGLNPEHIPELIEAAEEACDPNWMEAGPHPLVRLREALEKVRRKP